MAPVTVLRTYKPENGPQLAIIGSGIHRGDMIVTGGQLRLTPGAHVELLDAPSTARPQSSSINPAR
jgi:hypothetical protein